MSKNQTTTGAAFDPRMTKASVERVLSYHCALQALHDLVDAEPITELNVSEDGRRGLAFILQLLADDALGTYDALFCGVDRLIQRAEGVRHE